MQNLVKIKPIVDTKTPISYTNLKNKIHQRQNTRGQPRARDGSVLGGELQPYHQNRSVETASRLKDDEMQQPTLESKQAFPITA